MLAKTKRIPPGWRLASIKDVTKHQKEAREAITDEWVICKLKDGEIGGYGYNYEVKKGFFETGHKLVFKMEPGTWYISKNRSNIK